MSLASALLGLGIAMAIPGAVGTILALVNLMVQYDDYATEAARWRAWHLSAVAVGTLSVAGFLLGLAIPAVST